MTTSATFFKTTPVTENNPSLESFVSSFLADLMADAASSGSGKYTKVFTAYAIGGTGSALLSQVFDFEWDNNTEKLTVLNKTSLQETVLDIVVPESIALLSVLAIGSVATLMGVQSLPLIAVAAIGGASNAYYNAFLKTPFNQAVDYWQNEPQVSLELLDSNGKQIAGGFFEDGLTSTEEITVALKGLANYQHVGTFPNLRDGMTVKLYDLDGVGAGELRETYEVYKVDNLISKIETAIADYEESYFGNFIVTGNQVAGEYKAYWSENGSVTEIENRYIETSSGNFIFARSNDVLNVRMADGTSVQFDASDIVNLANESVYYSSNNDSLVSGSHSGDGIWGGNGDDLIFGNGGNDVVIGGRGDDNLFGGNGRDGFYFSDGDDKDTIADFSMWSDRIEFDDSVDFSDLMGDRTGDDLVVNYGIGDQITIKDFFVSDASNLCLIDGDLHLGIDIYFEDRITNPDFSYWVNVDTGAFYDPTEDDDTSPGQPYGLGDNERRAQDALDDGNNTYQQVQVGNLGNGSPLVLDMDGDGIELISYEDSWAWFDITESGYASRTAWVENDDALLAIDLNSNGRIDDNSELFGSLTEDGFSQLAAYDTNSDGKITSADTQFGDLLVWRDINMDGNTNPGELSGLSTNNITEIKINPIALANPYEIMGNEITHEALFVMNGQSHMIVDAWFEYSKTLTFNEDTSALASGVDTLPNLRGFGHVSDLHRAMSDDATLKTMVETFITDHADFADYADIREDFDAILFRWAGVDGVSPTSRGTGIDDARHLEFLEQYLQKSFNGNEIGEADPYQDSQVWELGAAYRVDNGYEELAQKLLYNFMVQANSDLAAVADYNPAIADFVIKDDLTFNDLDTAAPTDPFDELMYWMYLAKSSNMDPYMTTDVMEKIYDLQANSTVEASRIFNFINGGANSSSEDYNIFDNIIVGSSGADIMNFQGLQTSQTGNDIIFGGAGDDSLGGLQDDDIIIGGTGNDYVSGGEGNDIFVFNLGDGQDVLSSESPDGAETTDVIYMGAGITESDLSYARDGQDLVITVGTSGDQITIQNAYYNTAPTGFAGDHMYYAIDYIRLYDGTVIDMLEVMSRPDVNILIDPNGDLRNAALDGTNVFDDIIFGEGGNDDIEGHGGNDTLYGGDGDDDIYGGDGDDLIYGGAGDDYVLGGEGNNIIYGDDGDDYLYVVNSTGQNEIYGGAGADQLTATNYEGNTYMDGGAGNDTLISNEAADTFFVGNGDGDDILYGKYGNDVLEFGSGINAGDISITKQGSYNLLLTNTVTGQVTTLGNFYNSGYGFSNRMSEVRFADGTVWDSAYLSAQGQSIVSGTSGNDTLSGGYGIYGLGGDDTISGGYYEQYLVDGLGDDVLTGGASADRFVITAEANATDTITDFDPSEEGEAIDLSDFNALFDNFADVLTASVQSGNDVHINLSNGQTLVLEDVVLGDLTPKHFVGNAGINSAPTAVNDTIDVNYKTVISGNLKSNDSDADGNSFTAIAGQYRTDMGGLILLNEDGSYVYVAPENYSGNDTFTYTVEDGYGDTDTALVTFNNVDRGASTELSTSFGHDTYNVSAMHDDLYINEAGGFDVIAFAAGISESDIHYIQFNGNDLIIANDVSGRIIQIKDYFLSSADRVEKITFDNSDIHTYEDVLYQSNLITLYDDEYVSEYSTTDAAEYIDQTSGFGNIRGGGGDDILINSTSNTGGLYGEAGDDVLIGSGISTVMTGGAGADTFVFGTPVGSYFDSVSDFNVEEGDRIDFSDMFSSIGPLSSIDISEYLSINTNGNVRTIHFDADGGVDNFVQVGYFTNSDGQLSDVQER